MLAEIHWAMDIAFIALATVLIVWAWQHRNDNKEDK